ncbi:MAG: hypothetical protein HYU66_15400, partial [Armatimonadetes bacterium]|nr:hypothetical protein [Armatimonadota bacterium]
PARRAVVLLFSDRQNNDATDTPYVTVSGLRAPGGGGGSLPFTTIPLMLRDVAKPSQFWVFISVADRNPERGAATNRLMPTGAHLRYPVWLYLVCGLVALVGLCVALPALARARHIVVQWLSEYDNPPARVGDDFDLVVQGGAPDAAGGRRSLEIPMPAVTDTLLQRQMLNQQVGRLEIDSAGGRMVLFERYRVTGGVVGEDNVPRLPRDAGRMEQLRFEFRLEDGGWVPLQYEDLKAAVRSLHAGWRAQLWGGLAAALLALLLALAVRPQWVFDSFCGR